MPSVILAFRRQKLFFSSDGEAMLQFGRIGRCVIVLGDPSDVRLLIRLYLKSFTGDRKAGYRVAFIK